MCVFRPFWSPQHFTYFQWPNIWLNYINDFIYIYTFWHLLTWIYLRLLKWLTQSFLLLISSVCKTHTHINSFIHDHLQIMKSVTKLIIEKSVFPANILTQGLSDYIGFYLKCNLKKGFLKLVLILWSNHRVITAFWNDLLYIAGVMEQGHNEFLKN